MKIKSGPADVVIGGPAESGGPGPLGQVVATFSRFGVIDADNDVTLATAFEPGISVPISAYNHGSWQGALPVGRAQIRVDHEKAQAVCQFFLNTTVGRETFETIRDLGELGQWSYGFEIEDAERGTFDGKSVQFLKKLRLFEISPVLRGAGVRTSTDSAKASALQEYLRFQRSILGPVERDSEAARDLAVREHLRHIRRQLAEV